jgi:hypothetical protein
MSNPMSKTETVGPPFPGPWRAETEFWSAEKVARTGYIKIWDAEGVFVAKVLPANAPVIAAAPEMLEALKVAANGYRNLAEFVLSRFPQTMSGYGQECEERAEEIERLIDKVEGRNA